MNHYLNGANKLTAVFERYLLLNCDCGSVSFSLAYGTVDGQPCYGGVCLECSEFYQLPPDEKTEHQIFNTGNLQ